jgi:serine/threonine protein kinase
MLHMEALPDTIAQFYKVLEPLGSGSFGQVVKAVDTRTGVKVAIKMERKDADFPQLLYEARIMEQLGHFPGMPELYWFHGYKQWNVLVMPLLGRSLEDDRKAQGGSLPMTTIQVIAQQGLDRLRLLHEIGWAYRDIKPENFMWSRQRKTQFLFLIDFGLCKRVIYPGTSSHISYRTGKTLTGTPRYASLRAHAGEEQSRRDDLESFLYMLVYLARGVLPWQKLPAPKRQLSSEENCQRIGECKRSISPAELCTGLPACFEKTLKYARACSFEDLPDYNMLDILWRSKI